jgi:hypothetical protein
VSARDNGPTFNSHMVIVLALPLLGEENVNIENNKIFPSVEWNAQLCNPYFAGEHPPSLSHDPEISQNRAFMDQLFFYSNIPASVP